MAQKQFNAVITALGMYFPEKVYDNKYFESIVDTNDEWIVSRTGIRERRILENGATSDLATNAALDLLEKHNIKPEEIDCIIVAHTYIHRHMIETGKRRVGCSDLYPSKCIV